MKHITTPFTESVVRDLTSGDTVLISGTIYTARDAAHKRLWDPLLLNRDRSSARLALLPAVGWMPMLPHSWNRACEA